MNWFLCVCTILKTYFCSIGLFIDRYELILVQYTEYVHSSVLGSFIDWWTGYVECVQYTEYVHSSVLGWFVDWWTGSGVCVQYTKHVQCVLRIIGIEATTEMSG